MRKNTVIKILTELKPLIKNAGMFLVSKIPDRIEILDRVINQLTNNKNISEYDYYQVYKMIITYYFSYTEIRYTNYMCYEVSHFGKYHTTFTKEKSAIIYVDKYNNIILKFLKQKINYGVISQHKY